MVGFLSWDFISTSDSVDCKMALPALPDFNAGSAIVKYNDY